MIKSKVSFMILTLAVVAIVLISGCVGQLQTAPAPVKVIFTSPAELPEATEGTPYSYSFCEPKVTSLSDLCGGFEKTTNPTGGNPPYYFSLGSGVGFPPHGITLNNNGLLAGTPTGAGKSTFQVCAVDEGGRQACQTVSLTVKPKSEQPEKEPKKVTPSVKIESATFTPIKRHSASEESDYATEWYKVFKPCLLKDRYEGFFEVSGTATLDYSRGALQVELKNILLTQECTKEFDFETMDMSCPGWDDSKQFECTRISPNQPATGKWSARIEFNRYGSSSWYAGEEYVIVAKVKYGSEVVAQDSVSVYP